MANTKHRALWLAVALVAPNSAFPAHQADDQTYLDCSIDGSQERVGFIVNRKAKVFGVATPGIDPLPLFEDDNFVGVRVVQDGAVLLSILVNRHTLRYTNRAGFSKQESSGQCQVAVRKL